MAKLAEKERRDPFGPESAENDPALPEMAYRPPWWDQVAQWEPAVITGPPGSGKTAAALVLAYEWLKGREVFPLYCRFHPPAVPGERAALSWLSQTLAEGLAEFLARCPESFLESNLERQAAISRLLLFRLGPRERLATRFCQAGLACNAGVGRLILEKIEELAGPSIPEREETEDRLRLLAQARPESRQVTVLFVEPFLERIEGQVEQMQSLLNLALPLARLGISLKVVLPDETAADIRWEGLWVVAQWREGDLRELLKSRIIWAGVQSLNALATLETKQQVGDLDEFLIQRVNYPRQLVHLGNLLLVRLAEHSPEDLFITLRDLEVLSSVTGTGRVNKKLRGRARKKR